MKRAGPIERSSDIYAGRDLREIPAYALAEAAHYLRISQPTLRSWALGRSCPVKGAWRFFKPLLTLASQDENRLSFVNLVEAHVLNAIRRGHGVPLSKVRQALDYLRSRLDCKYPLADQQMETDGLDLFVEKYGQLINISQSGQLALRDVIARYLRRVDRDVSGLAVRLYPFTRKNRADEPRVVMIDPWVSFGRPVLIGTGIPTSVIAARYKAGESIDQLADDYGRQRLEIEEAIRCELSLQAA